LRYELAKHLKLLERQSIIKAWHDRNITAGEEWKTAINTNLESAGIILLLISADFLASDYCYDIEIELLLYKKPETLSQPIFSYFFFLASTKDRGFYLIHDP
jgi:TIR domain